VLIYVSAFVSRIEYITISWNSLLALFVSLVGNVQMLADLSLVFCFCSHNFAF